MSIEAVVGRIDQIMAMQQQLTDPTAAQASTAAATTGAAGATSTPTSFSDALNSALGTSAAADTSGAAATGILPATGDAATQVQAMVDTANSLLGKPYVMGGGHGGWGPQSGYDCSGFVSAVLHAGGYLSQPADTTALRRRRTSRASRPCCTLPVCSGPLRPSREPPRSRVTQPTAR